jgi:hypothetical protein
VPLTLAALVFVGPRREVRPLQRPGCGALLWSRMWPAVKELGMPLNLCCGAVDCVAVQFLALQSVCCDSLHPRWI